MKKTTAILLCLCMMLTFVSCTMKNAPMQQNNSSAEGTVTTTETADTFSLNDLVGEYKNIGVEDPLSMYTDFIISVNGEKNEAMDMLYIENGDSGVTFRDYRFYGTCNIPRANSLALCRKGVDIDDSIVGAESHRRLAEQEFALIPTDLFIIYNNYLINETDMDILRIDGTLPEKSYSNCIIQLNHLNYNSYRIAFYTDGSCYIDGVQAEIGTKYHFSGTYNIEDKIVNMIFTSGTFDTESINGTCEMSLYIDNGKIYDEVFKKIS